MDSARRTQRGFARPELMIFVALIGVGTALVVPTVTKILQRKPATTGDWILLAIGVVLGLLGLVPLARWTVGSWLESRRK